MRYLAFSAGHADTIRQRGLQPVSRGRRAGLAVV